MHITPRLGLVQIDPTDQVNGFPPEQDSNMTTLDNAVLVFEGTIAARPPPGLPGRYYLALDQFDGGPQGTLYQDNGTSWKYPNGTAWSQGTLGNQPAAGTFGRVYQATDLAPSPGLYADNGLKWNHLLHLGSGYGPLDYQQAQSSRSIASGKFVSAGAGVTLTLPPPGDDLTCGILALGVSPSLPLTVRAPGGALIYGPNAIFAQSGTLSFPGMQVSFICDGSSNWIVTAGEFDPVWTPIARSSGIGVPTGSSVPSYMTTSNLVHLRGAFMNNTGSTLNLNQQIGSGLPSPFAGSTTLQGTAILNNHDNTSFNLQITSGGGLLSTTDPNRSGGVLSGDSIGIDGLTYSQT